MTTGIRLFTEAVAAVAGGEGGVTTAGIMTTAGTAEASHVVGEAV
jgi:hypothetical protein